MSTREVDTVVTGRETTPRHTPLPWMVAERRSPAGVFWDTLIRNADGDPVASVLFAGYSEKTAQANAELIVRAVNAHEDLVKALEDQEEFLDGWLQTTKLAAADEEYRLFFAQRENVRTVLATLTRTGSR